MPWGYLPAEGWGSVAHPAGSVRHALTCPGAQPAAEGQAQRQPEAAGGRAAGEDRLEAAPVAGRAQHLDVVGAGDGRGRFGVLGGPVTVEEVLLQCVHAPTVHPDRPASPVD
nr:hypothetical protein KitaXyl93_69170 [Kitasatospora sp. Xyl93]